MRFRTNIGFEVVAPTAAALMALAFMGQPARAASTPAVGDEYIYQLVNGYNKRVHGRISYQVDRTGPDHVVFSVLPDNPYAGVPRNEIHTPEGNRLRGSLESHGVPVEYEFAPAYPAYVFPLEPGKSWSTRVNASVPGAGRPRSVRVDGQVLGRERIRVPAGEFDTVKIKRLTYPGDADFRTTETQIIEFEWYAPALGRVVRTERRSQWTDMSACTEDSTCDHRGDWSVLELVEMRAAKS
jgi:hypothetical protein